MGIRIGGRRAVTAGLVAGGAATALTAGLLTAGAASAATNADMVLKAVQTQSKDTDIGATGPSLGDRTVFSETLYKDDKKVGTDGVECVVTHVTKNSAGKITAVDSQCVGTLRLGRGQIAVQGLVSFDVAGAKPLKLVITGGTGYYKGAEGEMTVEATNAAGTKSKLTLDMTVG